MQITCDENCKCENLSTTFKTMYKCKDAYIIDREDKSQPHLFVSLDVNDKNHLRIIANYFASLEGIKKIEYMI